MGSDHTCVLTFKTVAFRWEVALYDSPHRCGACLFVGDAKYKKIEVQHPPNTDLYQMLAYTTALDLPGGMLIYAEGEAKPVVHEVRHSRKRLEIAALDLSGTLEEVLNRVLDLAVRVKVLRDEAKALRPAA